MSQENVEVIGELFDRFAAGDQTAWRDSFAEDIIWDTSPSTMPGAGLHRGHAAVERFFMDWLAAWENPTLEVVELIDAGDWVVVAFRWRGRGRLSGVEAEGTYFGIYDLSDGKVVRYRQFETRAQALEAVGLWE